MDSPLWQERSGSHALNHPLLSNHSSRTFTHLLTPLEGPLNPRWPATRGTHSLHALHAAGGQAQRVRTQQTGGEHGQGQAQVYSAPLCPVQAAMCVQARGVMGGAWTGACAESDWMMRVYAKKKIWNLRKKHMKLELPRET